MRPARPASFSNRFNVCVLITTSIWLPVNTASHGAFRGRQRSENESVKQAEVFVVKKKKIKKKVRAVVFEGGKRNGSLECLMFVCASHKKGITRITKLQVELNKTEQWNI